MQPIKTNPIGLGPRAAGLSYPAQQLLLGQYIDKAQSGSLYNDPQWAQWGAQMRQRGMIHHPALGTPAMRPGPTIDDLIFRYPPGANPSSYRPPVNDLIYHVPPGGMPNPVATRVPYAYIKRSNVPAMKFRTSGITPMLGTTTSRLASSNRTNPPINPPLQKLNALPMPAPLKLDPTAIEMNKEVPKTKWRMPLIPIVKKYAKLYNVPEFEIWRIIGLESNGNPNEHSPTGAVGVMQLEPGTAKEQGITNLWDRDQNVKGGASYYAHLLKQFGGNQRIAMAAYNAGPGAVYRYGGVPPFHETQKYVKGVPGSYKLTPAEIASHQALLHPHNSRRRR
jgi:hypothetical protein